VDASTLSILELSDMTRRQAFVLAACVVVWLAGVGAGARVLWNYQTTAGEPGTPPAHWPAASRIERLPGHATLLVVAHPQCPCSRATIGELSDLVGQVGERTSVHVLMYKPREFPAGWERTGLWDSAARIPGVSVHVDEDGEEAARFGAATSGQTILYDQDGRLQFSGGITTVRGHRGTSAGYQRIVALANGRQADAATSPVFGCALHDRIESQ
jgi:hypothetical protein